MSKSNDTISRKMAIEAFEPTHYKDWYTPIIIETLETLPSVQLVKESDGLVNDLVKDCISRKMAIDAINNCYCGGEDSCGEPWIYEDDAIKAVEQLPSAQPRRKTGKWIWWYEETFTEYATEYTPHCKCSECGRECAPSVATSSNFCRNCGADMRGESDE